MSCCMGRPQLLLRAAAVLPGQGLGSGPQQLSSRPAAACCQLRPSLSPTASPPLALPPRPAQAFTSKLAPEDAEAVVKDVRGTVEGAAWGRDGGPQEGEVGWEPLGMYINGLEVGGGRVQWGAQAGEPR
jgi:hypothetical protein